MPEYIFKTYGELVKHLISTGRLVRRDNTLVYNENGFDIVPDSKVPAEALKLANTLAKNVKKHFDFVRIDNKDIARWAEDIAKINRIDGYSWHEIEWVIVWVDNHDFWHRQIRSGSKLRKQFEELKVQIQSDKIMKQAKVADEEQKKREADRLRNRYVPTDPPLKPLEISDEQRAENIKKLQKIREVFESKKIERQSR